jgi:polysaccharide export outer membrane protein
LRAAQHGTRRAPLVAMALALCLAVWWGAKSAAGQSSVLKALPAAARESALPVRSAPRAERLRYVIAPDDVLKIDVVDVAELTGTYRVSPDGTLTLPLVPKPIAAAGLTLSQLSAVIADRLQNAGLVSTPHVMVAVQSSRANAVAIMGAVMKPQIYLVFGPTTLLDVLAQAGGLDRDAGNRAMITRGEMAMRGSGLASNPTDAALLARAHAPIKVDLKKLLEGDPGSNPTIYPGDKVTVERAGMVYVLGAVGRPGGYVLTGDWEKMTVLKAIALAGNAKTTAAEKRTEIIRPDPSAPGGRKEIAINLKKVLDGKAPDDLLEANDILYVPSSGFKKALHVGAGAGVMIGEYTAIYHP